MQADALRRHLARRLGRPVHDPLWNYLVELQFVEDVVLGAASLNDFTQQARAVLTAAAPSPAHRGEVVRPARELSTGQ